ncbi:MAG: hypothetical protein J6K25_06945 [Thermoguttaceae bacterium]|nr:hypothetical protein [Thermoguttaceae bacterium]
MTSINAPLFGVLLGGALTDLLFWFARTFYKTWNSTVKLVQWLGVKIYNVALEVFEFMFEKFVDAFLFLLDFFPDADLSGLDAGLSTLLEYWQGFDQILPLSEIFYCVNFLVLYFTIFTAIRLVVKLVPTIG